MCRTRDLSISKSCVKRKSNGNGIRGLYKTQQCRFVFRYTCSIKVSTPPPLPKKPSSYESLESSRSFYLISFDIKYVFCFICIFCEKNKFAVYQRHRYSTSVYSQCAMRCVFTTQCLSFLYNHVDLLCQSEGNIYLSFTDGNGNYWMYYDKN